MCQKLLLDLPSPMPSLPSSLPGVFGYAFFFFSSTFAPNFISVETIVNNRRVSTYDMVNLSLRALDCSYSNKKELDVTS